MKRKRIMSLQLSVDDYAFIKREAFFNRVSMSEYIRNKVLKGETK
jgi:hypothetical protein